MARPDEKTQDWRPWFSWQNNQLDDRTGGSRVLYRNTVMPANKHTQSFPTNQIRTSKYTPLTFLPKNLFEQFRRVANTYFLFMFILQTIPQIQAWPVTVAFVPILIVLSATAIKDAIEDIARAQGDRALNQQPCTILRGQEWWPDTWANVHVGDVIKLSKNHSVPADMVIISSSEEEGLCYVETKNLDGETNLKVKRGISALEHYREGSAIEKLCFEIQADAPIADLYKFNATLIFPQTNEKFSLGLDSLLLRGCTIRNVQFVIGVVLYTGCDTKIIMNSGRTPSKRTKIERLMNSQILYIFLIQIIMSALFAIGTGVWRQNAFDTQPIYFDGLYSSPPATSKPPPMYSVPLTAFINFWTLLVISQNLIPIALYASVEAVKVFQAYFISQDLEMYHEKSDQHCIPRSWNLSDDLGQIEYIFSDKTGTLTSNIMRFNQCTIAGIVFGQDLPSQMDRRQSLKTELPPRLSSGVQVHSVRQILTPTTKISRSPTVGALVEDGPTQGLLKRYVSFTFQGDHPWAKMLQSLRVHLGFRTYRHSDLNFGFSDHELEKLIIYSAKDSGREILASDIFEDQNVPGFTAPATDFAIKFFTVLALCHTTVAEYPDIPDLDESRASTPFDHPDRNRINYNAQSPDEIALVRAAANLGFVFLDRIRDVIHCLILGQLEEYTVLAELAFSSDRKRMSTITRSKDGQIMLWCKGADNVIYERLSPKNDASIVHRTNSQLLEFSDHGLRTLCVAYKELDEDYFTEWNKRYFDACLLNPAEREDATNALANEIESNLILLGGTAIEDRLQKYVPETIAQLMDAGLQIWMLTGDKLETAINIGLTCNLIDVNDTQFKLTATSDVRKLLTEWVQKLCPNLFFDSASNTLKRNLPDPDDAIRLGLQSVLIVEGSALAEALHPDLEQYFAEVALRCRSVICCRVSPKQKAKVVETVKRYRQGLTLAIGDGANDVTMIQTAHVGVGISGLEGRQATLASDYAISRFRFLRRLLLVHGRWSYFRMSEMTLYFFFKNFVFVFPMFWFQFLCGFSAQMIYHFSYQTFYNLVFTSLPIIFVATFDQDLGDQFCLLYPGVYRIGILGKRFTPLLFWLMILDGLWQGTVCFIIPIMTLGFAEGSHSQLGYMPQIFDYGVAVMASGILAANLALALQVRNWNWIIASVFILSIAIFFIYHVIVGLVNSNSFFTRDLFGIVFTSFSEPTYWLTLLVTVVLALLPRVVARYVLWTVLPSDSEIVRELEVLKMSKADRVISEDILGHDE